MIQLLNFIVSIRTIRVFTTITATLDMRVVHFGRVTTLITVVVVIKTAGKLVSRTFPQGTQLSFEGLQFEAEELILLKQFCFMVVKGTAK